MSLKLFIKLQLIFFKKILNTIPCAGNFDVQRHMFSSGLGAVYLKHTANLHVLRALTQCFPVKRPLCLKKSAPAHTNHKTELRKLKD